MIDEPKMKDSGERRTFSTGAVRDRGGFKPRPDLISPHANLREGAWLAKGAEKYGVRNYEKGIPISECVASLTRHLEDYKLGKQDEDHAAAIRTNAGFIIHYEEEIKAGRLDPKIDDMPKYSQQPTKREIKAKIPKYVGGIDPSKPVQWTSCDCSPECEIPTFYITGPMRGVKDFNFPAFDKATKLGRAQGLVIISPAERDRNKGVVVPTDPEELTRTKTENIIAKSTVQEDCKIISELDKDRGDGLILLTGWMESTGARTEVALALWLGLKFKRFLLFPSPVLRNMDSSQVEYRLFHQLR